MRGVRAAIALGALLAACGEDEATRVVVSVEADPEVRSRAAALRLRVEASSTEEAGGIDGGSQRDEAFEQTLATGAFRWPARTTLVPRSGDASRAYRVEASALDENGAVLVVARARSGFVRGETRALVLRLEVACVGVLSCREDETCSAGACRDARVDAGELPRFSGGEPDDAGTGGDACALVPSYADEDDDGHGDVSTMQIACGVPSGRVARADDCDDTCASCRPGGVETCDGERDEDCDGTADEGCACRAGASRACPGASDVGACTAGTQTCAEGAWSVCDGRVDPLPETCEGTDEDCDGRIDEGLVRGCEVACGRGTQTCRAGGWQACSAPAPRAETCEGTDEDCDGSIDEGVLRTFRRDADGDGFGDDTGVALACRAPAGYVDRAGDCDDACPTCRPGGTETCDGSRDEDCDGTVDESCACTSGTSRACPGGTDTGECTAGQQTCAGGAWGPCRGQVGPSDETCNARDDDCDARVDEALERACGPASEVGVCVRGTQSCSAGSWDVCRGAMTPGPESCNRLDDDCDGSTDEGSTCGVDAGPPDAGPPMPVLPMLVLPTHALAPRETREHRSTRRPERAQLLAVPHAGQRGIPSG